MEKFELSVKAPAREAQPAVAANEAKGIKARAAIPAQEARDITIPIDLPTSVEEAVKHYGEAVVLQNCIANMKVTYQGFIRAALRRNAEPQEIQKAVNEYKFGEVNRKNKVNKVDKANKILDSMSEEERANWLADAAKRLKESKAS